MHYPNLQSPHLSLTSCRTALKKAAENRKEIDGKTGKRKKVTISIIEAFGKSGDDKAPIPVKDVEEVLRLEYRSKLLNPKWRDSMLSQGSGGAYEISQVRPIEWSMWRPSSVGWPDRSCASFPENDCHGRLGSNGSSRQLCFRPSCRAIRAG